VSVTWEKWQEDILSREPKPQPIVIKLKWTRWDWFIAIALAAIACGVVVLIGDLL